MRSPTAGAQMGSMGAVGNSPPRNQKRRHQLGCTRGKDAGIRSQTFADAPVSHARSTSEKSASETEPRFCIRQQMKKSSQPQTNEQIIECRCATRLLWESA